MSDVAVNTTPEAPGIPEDFEAYTAWRRAGGELAKKPEESSVAGAEEPAAESSAASGTAKETETETEGDRPKKMGGFQKRINELTRERAELQRRLEELEGSGQKSADASGKSDAKTATAPVRPVAPKAEEFDTWESYETARLEYVERLSDWKLDQQMRARTEAEKKAAEEREQQSRDQQRAATFAERVKAVQARYPDFEQVAYSEAVPMSEAMRDVIVDSEQGPELAYWLGKNPEEAARIAQLPPLAAARELGRVEARLGGGATSPAKQPKATSAPEPIRPVSAAGRATSPEVTDESFAADYEAWKKARMAQLKRR